MSTVMRRMRNIIIMLHSKPSLLTLYGPLAMEKSSQGSGSL